MDSSHKKVRFRVARCEKCHERPITIQILKSNLLYYYCSECAEDWLACLQQHGFLIRPLPAQLDPWA